MRARDADVQGHIDCDGLSIGYEVFGDGETTVLLMPTWSIFPSRFWKFQVPFLSRHYRVVTFDGPGSGRSDRSTDPARYSLDAYAGYAVAVLDECEVEKAVAIGLSLGGAYNARLAALHPGRVLGLILVGAAIATADPDAARARSSANIKNPYPENPQGWEKYNIPYWHDHYEDFVHFFMGRLFTEAYSTKAFDDAVGWGLETSAEVLEAEAGKPGVVSSGAELLEGIKCPVLVVHGTDDAVLAYRHAVGVAQITGGTLHTMEGSGHCPPVRDPVHFNLLAEDFIRRVAG